MLADSNESPLFIADSMVPTLWSTVVSLPLAFVVALVMMICFHFQERLHSIASPIQISMTGCVTHSDLLNQTTALLRCKSNLNLFAGSTTYLKFTSYIYIYDRRIIEIKLHTHAHGLHKNSFSVILWNMNYQFQQNIYPNGPSCFCDCNPMHPNSSCSLESPPLFRCRGNFRKVIEICQFWSASLKYVARGSHISL